MNESSLGAIIWLGLAIAVIVASGATVVWIITRAKE